MTEKTPVVILALELENDNLESERIQNGGKYMVAFLNSFLSYLLLMLIIVVVAGCGIAIGLFLRRKKNSEASQVQESTKE